MTQTILYINLSGLVELSLVRRDHQDKSIDSLPRNTLLRSKTLPEYFGVTMTMLWFGPIKRV